MKKVICLILCVLTVISFSACSKNDPTLDIEKQPEQTEPEKPKFSVNEFTGEEDIEKGRENSRPVAVMINNIKIAQQVQTGITKADIVYETEVEGGITRLLAVFKDIKKAKQLGSVRSARYPYIDLALGHDAVFVHCGIDKTYALPHVRNSKVEDFDINLNPFAQYGFREKNGLSSEHTMYTSSKELLNGFNKLKVRTTTEKNKTFCEFNNMETEIFTGENAYNVSVPFSTVSVNNFAYNPETKKYTKTFKGYKNKDFKTGEAYEVSNVFVLKTQISNYPDGKHRRVALNGGSGYYISQGAYKEITWKKAGENQPIQYFNTDGTPLKINTGKSWICLENSSFSPKFTAKEVSSLQQ